MLDYLRDAAEIYRQSFATIRAEADLSRFPADVERVVVRLIHTCGQVDVAEHVAYTDDVVTRAAAALAAGAPVLCDSSMVAAGITAAAAARRQRGRLAGRRSAGGGAGGTAAAPPARRPESSCGRIGCAGAVLAIGNAPTALFRLLELVDEGYPRAGGGAGRAGRLRRLGTVQTGTDRPSARNVVSAGAGPPRRQCDGRRRRQLRSRANAE